MVDFHFYFVHKVLEQENPFYYSKNLLMKFRQSFLVGLQEANYVLYILQNIICQKFTKN